MHYIKISKIIISSSSLSIVFFSSSAYAIEFAQSPPTSVQPYVAPNVIISIDNSGSMSSAIKSGTRVSNNTEPINGVWPNGSKKINVLKYTLEQVFKDTELLPDGKIRFTWQTMYANGGTSGTGTVNHLDRKKENAIAFLDPTHRARFLKFVKNINAGGSTPSHKMFSQADALMRRALHINGPWAAIPGEKEKPHLACRRNYHIMMADGRWNSNPSGGNQDNKNWTLPDGKKYEINDIQTRIYRNSYNNTLADWSFRSWADNLQPSLYDPNDKNKQSPINTDYKKAPDSEKIGNLVLNKYWNPKYNPANWPHMVTFTIGFGTDAITWPGSNIVAPTAKVPFGYDGSFPQLIDGRQLWPKMSNENVRSLDLWHAAINGRGKFFAVEQAEDLEKAFREIFQSINSFNEPQTSSAASSGYSHINNDVGIYTAQYNPIDSWSGTISTSKILSETNSSNKFSGWNGKNTAELLDTKTEAAIDKRLIITTHSKDNNGIAFRWDSLSPNQQELLNQDASGTPDQRGNARLSYIRGILKPEVGTPTNAQAFRQRSSRQGAIINSNIWYTGYPSSNYTYKGYQIFAKNNHERMPMIYVGGNDGMLHGFSAENGEEKIAYVPKGVFKNLPLYSDPIFDERHHYFVDGSPFTGDVDINNTPSDEKDADWRTLLIGSLGAGGKGFFVLDVSNPGSNASTKTSTAKNDFFENNASSLVILDKTMHADEAIPDCSKLMGNSQISCIDSQDIGHIFSPPTKDESNQLQSAQITKLNNGRWAAIMGNGYNSNNQRPVLLIQHLDGDKSLHRLVATKDTPPQSDINTINNGLSAPRPVDINADGIPDIVYAGDLKGNLWKFDITSSDSLNWDVAFDGKPLYTAFGSNSSAAPFKNRDTPQPIFTAPLTKSITAYDTKGQIVRGMMVAFGTGRHITSHDTINTNVQTFYGIFDNTLYRPQEKNKKLLEIHPGEDCSNKTTSCQPAPKPSPVTSKDTIAQQSISSQAISNKNNPNRNFWTIENSEPFSLFTHKGWFLDLPETGERVLSNPSFYENSNIISLESISPQTKSTTNNEQYYESCTPSTMESKKFLTFINITNGAKPTIPLLDLNNDLFFNKEDLWVSRTSLGPDPYIFSKGQNKNTYTSKSDSFSTAKLPEQSLRPSWYQLR